MFLALLKLFASDAVLECPWQRPSLRPREAKTIYRWQVSLWLPTLVDVL